MIKPTKSLFATLLLLTALQSCSDYTEDLGGGYFYNFEASDARGIYGENAHGGQIPPNVTS